MRHATLSTCWIRPWRKLVLASRQYPQGGETTSQNNRPNPLSLDGRGIKGEGENDASASSRHCGLDPQSRGEGWGIPTRQHNRHRPVILASRQYPQGGGEVESPLP